VWFVVSGEDKAKAVRLALSGAGELQIPASAPKGLNRTLWLLDEAAAQEIPHTIRAPRT
jgi:6-phosphogluconolactonase